MKRRLLSLGMVALAAGAAATQAAESYNQNITAIFGAGNPNDGWTTSTDVTGDLVLGLRAKNRTNGDVPDSNDVFGPFMAGTIPPANNRAYWNYEFSIDVNPDGTTGYDLTDFRFELDIDLDPSVANNPLTVDPINFWNDNSMGNNTTLNGQGVEPGAAFSGSYSKAQNSQNIVFAGLSTGNATWEYALRAYSGSTLLASTTITVLVGEGGGPAPVPEPSTVIGGVALGLLALRRIAKRK